MFEFHTDRKRYFEMQIENTQQYVIPFIEERFAILPGMHVLEIGCGEGGVLKAFIDKGCIGVGVELDEPRIRNGEQWLKEDIDRGRLRFVSKDIYKVDAEKELGGRFDIIVLKDVIEHIHNQQKLIGWMKSFLKENGVIFFGFPPWQMPFGGHQQICRGKILSKLPYYHLLPKPIYRLILKKNSENWQELLEIKETGISIERFQRICKKEEYDLLHKRFYLFNPIYRYKFGLRPRRQATLISATPWVRNFFTTCVYYLIQAKTKG
jgi:2-polyprenyl-3-methyl-5-hydroxy-6-metoxy-1,4-benzoquinol methylase